MMGNIIKHQEKVVVTTRQIAEAFKTEEENIRKNFTRNKERFIEQEDYFSNCDK